MKEKVAELLAEVREEERRELMEHESKRVLAVWGIPVNRTELARDLNEALEKANQIGYPVVLKIASPDIIHKSEAKGIEVGLRSEIDLRRSFNSIIENVRSFKSDAKILGVTVQEHLPPAREVIVGTFQDPTFGATVMFGLGGIWVEVLKDVSFRLPPLDAREAEDMIKEIKGYPLLAGVRGEPPVDVGALIDIIQKAGGLAYEFPDIKEMDMNPIFAFEKGAVAADARIILNP